MRFETITLSGAPGAPGAPGEDGADGQSAYEIAVANGFVGSEAEWLASIEGPQGPMGPPGGSEGYSTKVILMDRMTPEERALVPSTGPYIDDLLADIMAEFQQLIGGEIIFPAGTVRFAATVHVRVRTRFAGEGTGIQGVGKGSIIIFDDDQDGFIVHNSNTGPSGYEPSNGLNAQGSQFFGLTLKQATTAAKHGSGIRMRTPISIESCSFDAWAEHGIIIQATTNTALSFETGNADVFYIANCRVGQCRSHGIYIDGNTANAGSIFRTDISNCLGCGIFDSSFLGNVFFGIHCANNEQGAFRTDDANNSSAFIGCYTEGDQLPNYLQTRNLVLGGTQGSTTIGAQPYADFGQVLNFKENHISPFTVEEASLVRKQLRMNVHGNSALDVILGGNITGHASGTILDGNGMSFAWYDTGTKELSWRHNGDAAKMPLRLSTYYSVNEDEAAVAATVPWAANTAYVVGDKRLNDGGKTYVCSVAGTSAGAPAWTATTAYVVGNQVTNDLHPTRVYRCTVAGTSGTTGPLGLSPAIDGTVTWVRVAPITTPWTTGTAYVVGDHVTNDSGKVYQCTVAGTSGDPPAWAPNTFYSFEARVTNDGGKRYEVGKLRGVSAPSGGPTGTGTNISDNVATVDWAPGTAYSVGDKRLNRDLTYICVTAGTSKTGASPGTGGPTGTGYGIIDGTCVWDAPGIPSIAYSKTGILWNYIPIAGPTGRDLIIYDGSDVVPLRWAFVFDAVPNPVVPTGPTGTGRGILDGSAQWNYQTIGPGQMIMPSVWVPNGSTKYARLDFLPIVRRHQQQTIATNADFTLTPATSPFHTRHTGTLTANRAVTLSTTGAVAGTAFKITRTGSGAFNLNVGTGPLKALATGQWCEVTFDGSAYYLSAYGAL